MRRAFPLLVLFLASAASAAEPDLEIVARVRAERLIFHQRPMVEVKFTGDSRNENVSDDERFNLPEEVEPGVIYRDIEIRAVITTTFPDAAALLARELADLGVTVIGAESDDRR
ncbi:MAG: hypothetical protein KY459_00590 [Acidobacteria bacterium]|nr:hypothetical protein [Acidobacteriota bacterium]